MPEFVLPTVTEEDVAWVCKILKLPTSAFVGADGADSRISILQSNDTIDVEACPGSGKTTLLVAKLAILARKWTDRRRGICVLSHTNVARKEIEGRLSGTSEGRSLLSYPHFVGTIHGFVNEFLAMPWLRSKSIHIKMVDDVRCVARRRKMLPLVTRNAVSNYPDSIFKVRDFDYSVGDIPWGRVKGSLLGRNTTTYRNIQKVCKKTSEDGYFCYDEMFIWARELLQRRPENRGAIRARFPILFLDEVQDTTELQSSLLFDLFQEGPHPVVRQRFGDSNQAIYHHGGQDKEGAKTDSFPNRSLLREISNSHRFGPGIAAFANPLALRPQGLQGMGPIVGDGDHSDKRHAIFLFCEQTVQHVLPCYGAYLLEIFSEEQLQRGIFTAVGGVHAPNADDNVPRHVGHYWPGYDHRVGASDHKPDTLLEYILLGKRQSARFGESYYAVEKLAEGIWRLVGILDPSSKLEYRRSAHRRIRAALISQLEAAHNYRLLVPSLLQEEEQLLTSRWVDEHVPLICNIVGAIVGRAVVGEEVESFLRNSMGNRDLAEVDPPLIERRSNVYPFPPEDPMVNIRLGSIHSVKGETHTATLVLETYYRTHSLQNLKPWLIGKKAGWDGKSAEHAGRLKQHYVAMTRPSHLICLAMKEDSLKSGDITHLKSTWRVASVRSGRIVWL